MQAKNPKQQQWGLGIVGFLTPCLLVAFVWLWSMGGATAASEVSESNAPQNFGGTSPYVVPAAAFRSDGNDSYEDYFFSFFGGYVREQDVGSGAGCMMAPAYLPEHVFVQDMFVSLYDNDAVVDSTVRLRRVNNYTGDVDILSTITSSGANSFITVYSDTSIDEPWTVFPTYSYYVTACLASPDIRLYSVRLYYETNESLLPIMIKN